MRLSDGAGNEGALLCKCTRALEMDPDPDLQFAHSVFYEMDIDYNVWKDLLSFWQACLY